MNKLVNWFNVNRNNLVRNSFLIPILLVVIISISHVVSWYDLGNPISWAIYLSVAIEIFALASVSAASIKMSRTSIWFLFGLVTLIQIIGNIFFEYQYIDITNTYFLSWVELINPLFVDWDLIDHRRFLATIQGGTLPLMSLTALHFYIKFNDNMRENENIVEPTIETKEEPVVENKRTNPMSSDTVIPVQAMSKPTGIDAVAEIEKILREELNTAQEKYKDEVEPIDEEAILSEVEEDKEPTNINITGSENLSENLNLLDKNDKDEKNEKEPESFGPPNLNNI
jgi:hypothetical protein